MDFLIILLAIYIFIGLVYLAYYTGLLLNREMFDDGFRLHHVIFFPSVIAAMILFIVIRPMTLALEFVFNLLDFRIR